MSARLDLIIEKGSTFKRTFTWKARNQETGQLEIVNLTGYSARSMMREEYDSPQPFISLTVGNGLVLVPETGEIQMTITAEQSAPILAERGVWDLEVFTISGEVVYRLLEGKVKLKPEVTK